MVITKKVEMNITELDGNAFAIMGAFSKQAQRQGWSKEEIDFVISEMQSGDYDNLIQTLLKYTN